MPGFVELNAASAFSFLRASSLPEDLVERAAALGITALALVDRDGVAGAPRFFKAARSAGVRPIVGAALSLDGGGALPLLVETQRGYRNLCRLVTRMKAGVPKGEGRLRPEMLDGLVEGLFALPGVETLCPEGTAGASPDTDRLARIVDAFGPGRVLLDVQRHRRREQEAANRGLLDLADALGLRAVATNGVRHATARGRPLLDVLTCIREKRTLATAGRLLSENAERHLKGPRAMAVLFADRRDLLRNACALAERLTFTLEDLGYRFPDYPVPEGESQFSFLCRATEAGARERYRPYHEKARRQIERELALIGKLSLSGYFLIVWDLVNFCRREGILVQGRGSAANSAVCYSLGITAVDPVGMGLLFERFLSEERGEWPDIDLDLPSGDRRERVIQHVYERYGAAGAAMTANVITYRDRSASREIGKVLGIPTGEIDRLATHMRSFEYVDPDDTLEKRLERAGLDRGDRRIALFARLFDEIQDLPRHLGQHSGGMVMAQGRLDEVVPLEPASMPDRVIVQWDKEDCADLGIIKVDLLGLGMMAAIEDGLALLRGTGVEIDLAHLPPDDPAVYAMLREADTVGVFQVESRAQMATLPRMKPDHFYDLVVEVAIIRPGPVVGKMVHPYLRRRNGEEPVGYLHPSLEPILERTLGVPLFQEQLLRIAMAVAGFTGGEAEELRRAMGFKRSEKRMKAIETRLRSGMAERGITGETADTIVRSISSFALYGFPESHAASFALIAYASAFLKRHHPAAFTCALLNNQPMGFYHPFTLVKDAQRHGVRFRPVDVTRSSRLCTLEEGEVRLGLSYVRGLRAEAAETIEAERARRPFASLQDFVDRAGLRRDEQRDLAEAGALNAFGLTRRSALWQVEKAGRPRGTLFRNVVPRDSEEGLEGPDAPDTPEVLSPPDTHGAARVDSPLPDMGFEERLTADLASTGLTLGPHPVSLFREDLRERGVLRAAELPRRTDGEWVRVAGAVICRQRPGTAAGFLFLTLEDETGLVNVIVRPDLFHRERAVLVSESALEVDGVLQARDGLSVRAHAVRKALAGVPATPARSFR
ncbi:MAG TPA: error-prone DNA polymerase [Vicinamibacteria bacterium]|nr:error-prone DNA polymerase [Vicinamibacteria bacterium]